MKPIISILFFLSVGGIMSLTSAVDIYQAKCTITEGGGYKVDSCDASQHLSCQSGRCMCDDIGNQLYDYLLVPEKINSRTKRGSKKKTVAKGIAAGVAGGAVGYVVAKGVSNSGSGSGSSSRQSSKFTKVYSCYGRVGSMCQLDYNNVNVVTLPTTTSTSTTTSTTASPSNITDASSNTTVSAGSELSNITTTGTTSTTPAPTVVDVTKLPKCIRHAVCVTQNKGAGSIGGHVVKTDVDPRIGVCACPSGYKATTTDRCEKSGSNQITASLPIFASIFYALVISKFF